jgi:hypothetical protein
MKRLIVLVMLGLVGCSQSVPQAHKGRRFDSTGPAVLWLTATGFQGSILGPGTYYTGMYGGMRLVHCGQVTHKETLPALTKDGVQFGLDVYIRMSAKCDDPVSVKYLLEEVSPAPFANGNPQKGIPPSDGQTITNAQIYGNYVRPAIGEAVRSAVSPFVANDINPKRELVFAQIQKGFASRSRVSNRHS